MNQPAANAEVLFARALEIPRGVARESFLIEASQGDSGLRREVESLLQAHEEAADFFDPLLDDPVPTTLPDSPLAAPKNILGIASTVLVSPATFLPERENRIGSKNQTELSPEDHERRDAVRQIRALAATQGSTLRDPPSPELPGYRVLHPLGSGGLGVVYAAEDEKLHRRVALKILRPQTDASVRRRLLDEARRAAALNDPAIVTVFAVLDDTDPPAIVMEHVEGFPIDHFAAKLNFEQKARMLREVARGLAAAHEQGLIHRDLKPENIIVGPDLQPRILDFGLALSLDEALKLGRGFEGTPLYASPEQVRGEPLGTACDLFSFGALMFKVLTGRTPFVGNTVPEVLEAIATTAPPMLREVAVGVPEALQAVCLACLAWKPGDRPTAEEVALESGRFLVGEPMRLRPKLYGDQLRRGISEHSHQAQAWEDQKVISREERDSLEVIHRRLLADEDHWIIDARRITLLQTLLSFSTWLAVVATILTVWMLRDELAAPARWLLPSGFTLALLAGGWLARRLREDLAAATFLAGAALAIAPCTLALLAEFRLFSNPVPGVTQLFPTIFTNQQVVVAALIAFAISAWTWRRLGLTGFAWTTAALGVVAYIGVLLLFNWLEFQPETKALYSLPLVVMEGLALGLERRGRVRWTLPFHLVGLLALTVGLDVIAWNGPTLSQLGVTNARWPYFDHERLQALSVALNGLFFLALSMATQGAKSLDLRRGSKLLEILAMFHLLSALFANALNHRGAPDVRIDVGLYMASGLLLLVLAPFRSRWRMLVGGLAGCGLGSYLLIDLELVARRPFVIGLGCCGLLVALATFLYLRYLPRLRGTRPRKPREMGAGLMDRPEVMGPRTGVSSPGTTRL